MMNRLLPMMLTLALMAAATLPARAADPRGTWMSQSGETRVRFADCGGQLCGTIVASAQARDEKNEDPALRSRALVGVRMITMRANGTDSWQGSLYNFQDGKTYTGRMTMPSANAMSLSGCVMGGLICRSQTWTRVN